MIAGTEIDFADLASAKRPAATAARVVARSSAPGPLDRRSEGQHQGPEERDKKSLRVGNHRKADTIRGRNATARRFSPYGDRERQTLEQERPRARDICPRSGLGVQVIVRRLACDARCRRIRDVGAVTIKNSVCALPASETARTSSGILREVVEACSDASIRSAGLVDGLSSGQVKGLLADVRTLREELNDAEPDRRLAELQLRLAAQPAAGSHLRALARIDCLVPT